MTKEAERRFLYWQARRHNGQGAVVEIGPWLGGSTSYIAAGIRDAGTGAKVQVYDKFIWVAGGGGWEARKAGREPGTSFLEEFKSNLGCLVEHIEAHQSSILDMRWNGDPVELMFIDAPKRIRDISKVLTLFGPSLIAGRSVMVWQDFMHFPSFEIPACLSRLWGLIEPVHAVTPGTSVAFRVRHAWREEEVSEQALALDTWTPGEIERAWAKWMSILPPPARARFACGAAMFLHDIGKIDEARAHLQNLVCAHPDVLPKWRYLATTNLVGRYAPLFEVLSTKA